MQRFQITPFAGPFVAAMLLAGSAPAQGPSFSTFDGFTIGASVDGQGGWRATNPNWDEEIVDDGTGNLVWRVSNAVTSGSFGDQPFAPGTDLYAGETGALHPYDSATAVTNRFIASFDIRSATGAPQPGLDVTISPDDGQGGRQSFLSIEDNGSGIDIDFFDSQGNHPVNNPNGGFVLTTIAEGLSYTENHQIVFDITFVDGNTIDVDGNVFGNDICNIYVDGELAHSGTTWESYWWTTTEGTTPPSLRAIDTLLFRISTPGGAAAAGAGYYIDNVFVQPQFKATFDQDVYPDVIFGSGNVNGEFTMGYDTTTNIELGLRGKVRFNENNLPENTFNSNGDGTYTFVTGSPTGGAGWVSATTPRWAFEMHVNTDRYGSTGDKLSDLTYELGMDVDPGAGTNYLAWDFITPGESIPYTPPVPVDSYDHSMGDNTTANGGGVEVYSDPVAYAANLAQYNVLQQAWNWEFFNEAPFDTFDPNLPGKYDFYLAAFKNGEEVARTAITVVVVSDTSLTLEAAACQTDQDPNTPGVQVAYTLNLRNPNDLNASGYQAFLAFDAATMTYEPALSSYDDAIFDTHIQAIATAQVAPGQLRLDGNTLFDPATNGDALLATLVFTVAECSTNSVDFDLTQPFASEVSFSGVALPTLTVDSPDVVSDSIAPVIAAAADIVQAADAGSCTGAVVNYTAPAVTDACDASPTLVCTPASGSTFPVGTTTVTCTATDACGNQSTSTFDVTVTDTNLVYVDVKLVGVSTAVTRCIHFVLDDCTVVADVELDFDATGRYQGMVEVPCGVYTSLCAKDQQHTLWDSTGLVVSANGANYEATEQHQLEGGDTDDDGDVDINDVTFFMAQYGGLAAAGGCPWDGTRDADFSNDGAVGSEDYTFLTANWLSLTDCACNMPFENGSNGASRRTWMPVSNSIEAALDRDNNGRIDHRDVRRFERENGLPTRLSDAIRRQTPASRR
jgi:hypothetical protein